MQEKIATLMGDYPEVYYQVMWEQDGLPQPLSRKYKEKHLVEDIANKFKNKYNGKVYIDKQEVYPDYKDIKELFRILDRLEDLGWSWTMVKNNQGYNVQINSKTRYYVQKSESNIESALFLCIQNLILSEK